MHACLYVDEIVRLIAREIIASGRKAVAVALACCCKSLEDPVLDELWETQKELNPLLKSLPGGVWDSRGRMVCSSNMIRSPSAQALRLVSLSKDSRRSWNGPAFEDTLEGCEVCETPHPPPDQVLPVLQFHSLNEPLFPNLKSLRLLCAAGDSIPFIPLFVSPKITSILFRYAADVPRATAASMFAALPTLCPNLERITILHIPRDPMITAAVSAMLLATNRNTLQQFHVDSPLTEEASKVIYKLPNLRNLWVVIDGPGLLPTLVLPDLTRVDVEYDDECHWLQGFRGATFGKLTSITFRSESSPIGDFLEAFESVALTTSISATLTEFEFYTPRRWQPNYRSLLPFTQLKKLDLHFRCTRVCSSTIDDDIITDLARAMPKLEILYLGSSPCQIPGGVTAKGLVALAYYCLHLSRLCVHFRVASLREIPQVASGGKSNVPREDCALTDLEVGETYVPEVSTPIVAPALLRIFPRLDHIEYSGPSWRMIARTINTPKPTRQWLRAFTYKTFFGYTPE